MKTEQDGLNPACFECRFRKKGKCELEDMLEEASMDGIPRADVIGSLDTERVNKLMEQGCPNID